MVVMGIDPGSQVLGWSVIQWERSRAQRVIQGVLKAPKGPFMGRVQYIADGLQKLMTDKRPDVVVVESLFLGKNPASAFKLGHIRGACVVEAMRCGARIHEMTPREVKKGITGRGGADKNQLRQSLYAQLGIAEDPSLPLDASDALAIAYVFCLQLGFQQRLSGGPEGVL